MMQYTNRYITLIFTLLALFASAQEPADSLALDSIMERQLTLREVVVTARESAGPTSASLIGKEAMKHLQPSSFTDIIELLPGNISKDPEMGTANIIRLREASNASSSDDYNTSSLGTAFVIDGVQINTSADMQSSPDATQQERSVVGKGVDMRQLSTDDIEQVEIVRGIPSVEYGELTSGLVNIKRKNRITRLEARFKADQQSQLFYLGKGFAMPGEDWTLNASVDYLDSKIDPRNARENFKRVTASLRSNKKWTRDNLVTTWNSSLGYTGTFERDKNDPDLTVNGTVDYYTSDKNGVTWNNTLVFLAPLSRFLQNVTLTTGLNYEDQRLHQEKTVSSNRLYPLPISTVAGPNYVGYLPMVYDALFDMYGKPFTALVKASMNATWRAGQVANSLKIGAQWDMSKNFGDGQVYDLSRPLTAGNNTRPRAFSDIPAMHQMSAWVENTSRVNLGAHRLAVQLGVRETQLLHLDSRFYLANRPYFDPRANITWNLPSTWVDNAPIGWELNGGIGWLTKMPVSAFLYPDRRYTDYTQLNYYHNEEAYRVMNVATFIDDLTNYNLKAARNFKWEVRGDVTYKGNRLSVTYFRENMTDGFRQTGDVIKYTYNKYDASGFDPYAENRAPTIDELPYTEETKLAVVSRWENGSRTLKEGVEFTYSSRRFPVVRTRVTVSGAWFRTTLDNSQPLWYKPAIVINGTELQYVGLYDDHDGNVYQSFNTNFVFDTDVPRLGLNFSISVQNMWFTSNQPQWKSGVPTHWMGPDMVIHEWTPDCANDPYLQHLIRSYSSTAFDKRTVPIATTFNFKATKSFWQDRVGIALYVNRILSITPDYKQYGVVQRRYSSPYFGMELNLKI